MESAEREAVTAALRAAGGNRSRAAQALGIGRNTLYRKMREFGWADPAATVARPVATRNHSGAADGRDTPATCRSHSTASSPGRTRAATTRSGSAASRCTGGTSGTRQRLEADEIAATGWLMRPRGAYVMGRNMFGPVRGEWDEDWRGWWGTEPPYHAPVFVLTHHTHEPIEMEGGTTFHFVTEGFEAAYAQASETAGDKGVDIAGGASTVRQALNAGVDRRVHPRHRSHPARCRRAHVSRGVDSFDFEPVEVLHSPLATHIRYRKVAAGG